MSVSVQTMPLLGRQMVGSQHIRVPELANTLQSTYYVIRRTAFEDFNGFWSYFCISVPGGSSTALDWTLRLLLLCKQRRTVVSQRAPSSRHVSLPRCAYVDGIWLHLHNCVRVMYYFIVWNTSFTPSHSPWGREIGCLQRDGVDGKWKDGITFHYTFLVCMGVCVRAHIKLGESKAVVRHAPP